VSDRQANVREESRELIDGKKIPPVGERLNLLQGSHALGHFGAEAMVSDLVDAGFYWSSMRDDALELVSKCVQCQRFAVGRRTFHPMKSLLADRPMDHIVIDLLGPWATTPEGYSFVLVVVDVHSRFVFLRALRDKSARSVAEALLLIFADFGPAKILSSDNGGEFSNELLRGVLDVFQTAQRFTSAYHPRGNGLAERMVGVSLSILRKIVEGDEAAWALRLSEAQFAINHHVASVHGCRPGEVMFGRP
jgi:transposase InsO family protein